MPKSLTRYFDISGAEFWLQCGGILSGKAKLISINYRSVFLITKPQNMFDLFSLVTFKYFQIDVDVTKFRVQPFKSYKVCISLDDYDYTADYIAEPVCTHLFSFEKYVPYNPDMEEEVEDKSDLKEDMVSDDTDINYVKSEKREEEEVIEHKQKEEKVIESVLKQQLDNIENFVRDDFKVKYLELKDELIEKVEDKILHANSSVENLNGPRLIMIIPLILARTFLNMVMM